MLRIPLALVAAALFIPGGPLAAEVLTPTEVQAAWGRGEVHRIPKGSLPAAQADLNFADSAGRLILSISVGSSAFYEKAKRPKKIDLGGQQIEVGNFRGLIKDLGDEAFDGPPGPVQWVLYVRRGSRALAMTSFIDPASRKPTLSIDALKSLAKIAILRL